MGRVPAAAAIVVVFGVLAAFYLNTLGGGDTTPEATAAATPFPEAEAPDGAVEAHQEAKPPRATAAPTDFDVNPTTKRFLAWLNQFGAGMDGAVVANVSEATALLGNEGTTPSGVGFGVYATRDLDAKYTYLQVPLDLILSVSNSHSSPVHPLLEILRPALEPVLKDRTEDALLYVFLHFEMFVLGSNSKWAPYFNTLPTEFPSTPLQFSTLAQALVKQFPQRGAQFDSYIKASRLMVLYILDNVMASVPQVYGNVTDDSVRHALVSQLVHCMIVVHSRAALLPVGNSTRPELALVPGYDFVNHGEGKRLDKTTIMLDSDPPMLKLSTRRPHARGDELLVSYSQASCAFDFLLSYGFVPASHSADCLDLKIILPSRDDADTAALRLKLLESTADTIVEMTFGRGEMLMTQVLRAFGILSLSPAVVSGSAEGIEAALESEPIMSAARRTATRKVKELKKEMDSFWGYFVKDGESLPDAMFKPVFGLHYSNERIADEVLAALQDMSRNTVG